MGAPLVAVVFGLSIVPARAEYEIFTQRYSADPAPDDRFFVRLSLVVNDAMAYRFSVWEAVNDGERLHSPKGESICPR